MLGNIYMAKGDIEHSIDTCERAVELAPSNSLSVSLLGKVLLDAGRVTEGIQKIKRAIRLCPFPPVWFFALLGVGYHLNGDNKAALFALELAIEHEPGDYISRLWYCSALVEMGRLGDAAFAAKPILENDPDFSAAAWAESFKSKSHERLKDNLLAAGLPE
ncbi:MAG: tetratricopeptide repeat protein [Gammaproteobacteria bacterium]|nr:tetratricopeptide repeat protein [Gammaproteobacteria bacterium]